MKRTLSPALFLALAGWLAVVPLAMAHAGPEHDIEELTDRLAKEGESADLYLQRAIEYQVLGKYSEATRDLEQAMRFDRRNPAIQRELGRTYFAAGKTNEALDTVTRAIGAKPADLDHAALLVVRAEILRARKRYEKAADDVDLAVHLSPGNVEWYLFRSQLQAHLKQTKERIAGLDEAIKETGSGVLETERVEALLDDGQFEPAMATIEKELEESRWKASWLLRRARVLISQGKKDEAKADLKKAAVEIELRLNVNTPDPSLLADRGLARELLGDKAGARKDYEDARDKGITEEWVLERLRVLKDKDKDKDKDKEKDP
ncbi:MAG TPA: tetratricopeptide repeat protein [Candidatus Limnocylindria bacterium]|jgi:tetratricopeptide (TPR) repeat protein|nr:tetratricopeptide repeat protein [Candidatus Limnocylindria bacterium]